MGKNSKLGALVASAGKSAKNLVGSAVQTLDQNEDGKFNFSDVATIAESMGNAAKKGAQALKETAAEKTRELEAKSLQPIFAAALDTIDSQLMKFIRVSDRDKKHAESLVCQGSVGYFIEQKDVRIVNIFWDSIDTLGLTFYPNRDYDFYCVDPCDKTCYIALDEYFNYLKIVRINELKKVAQRLGAKRFKVTLLEERASSSEKKAKAYIKAAAAATVDADHYATEKKYALIKIEAENEFPGHAPMKPQLKYWQGDPSIQTLVALRMDKKSPMSHEQYMLSMNSSSGMRTSDAVKIDMVLKGLKCAGDTTIESETRNESRRYLEYEIEF